MITPLKGKEICHTNCDIIRAIIWCVAAMQNKYWVRIPDGNAPLPTKNEEVVTKRNIVEFLAGVLREGRGAKRGTKRVNNLMVLG